MTERGEERRDRNSQGHTGSNTGNRQPDRKQYAIIASGIGDFESWLATPLAPDEPPQGELFLKVTLSLLSGRDAAGLLEAQRELHMQHMRSLRASKRLAATEAERVLADYGLFHLEADIKWMEHTQERLDRSTA